MPRTSLEVYESLISLCGEQVLGNGCRSPRDVESETLAIESAMVYNFLTLRPRWSGCKTVPDSQNARGDGHGIVIESESESGRSPCTMNSSNMS